MTIPIRITGGRRRPEPIRFNPEDAEFLKRHETFASVRLLNQTPSRMCKAALACVLNGFYVFPCGPWHEPPLISRWWERASRDPKQIMKWWTDYPDASIGFPTGRHNGVFAICLDDDEAYANFEALWDRYATEPTLLPPPSVRQTTPYGGVHIFLKYQPDVAIRTSYGELAPGIGVSGYDIDGNPTGYVVLAPSSPYGNASPERRYKWWGFEVSDLRGGLLDPADPWIFMLCMFSPDERQKLADAGIYGADRFSFPYAPVTWRVEAATAAGLSPVWAPHVRREDQVKQDEPPVSETKTRSNFVVVDVDIDWTKLSAPRISKRGSVHE